MRSATTQHAMIETTMMQLGRQGGLLCHVINMLYTCIQTLVRTVVEAANLMKRRWMFSLRLVELMGASFVSQESN